jgi:hypothetical protein
MEESLLSHIIIIFKILSYKFILVNDKLGDNISWIMYFGLYLFKFGNK